MLNECSSLEDWIAHLAGSISTPHRLRLALADFAVTIESNSAPLIGRLERYFHPFSSREFVLADNRSQATIIALESPAVALPLPFVEKTPDPGKTRVKEEYCDLPDGRVVRKRLTGMHFLFGGDRHLAIGPCLANDNQVINFVNNRYIQFRLRMGDLLCHAAGVAQGPRGLAMAGFAGQGKSTLALHIIGLGHNFVSNDRLLMREQDRQLEMRGVPKLPRVNPGTVLHNPALAPVMSPEQRAAAASLPPSALWNLEQKYDVDIDQCFGTGRCQLFASMTGLVMLNWRRDGGPLRTAQVDPAARLDLVEAFRKSAGLFYEGDDDAPAEMPLDRYVELLRLAPMFEFSGGADFAAGAAACDRFLRTGRMEQSE